MVQNPVHHVWYNYQSTANMPTHIPATRRFTFDQVYDQGSSQEEVYLRSAQGVVLSILQVRKMTVILLVLNLQLPCAPAAQAARYAAQGAAGMFPDVFSAVTTLVMNLAAGLQRGHHRLRADGHRQDVHHGGGADGEC